MFSGEEQGLHGSRAYVKAHEQEIWPRFPRSWFTTWERAGSRASDSWAATICARHGPGGRAVQGGVKLDELSLRGMAGGTDHASFLPQWACRPSRSFRTKPSIARPITPRATPFDKVYPDEINQGAKVLAAWAYNVAMLPELLPRNPKPAPPGMFDSPQFQQPGEKNDRSPTQRTPAPATASSGESSAPGKPKG